MGDRKSCWIVALHAIFELPRYRRKDERYRIWKENIRESAPLIIEKGLMGGYSTFQKSREVTEERGGFFKGFRDSRLAI
jgi:hypothetical protein